MKGRPIKGSQGGATPPKKGGDLTPTGTEELINTTYMVALLNGIIQIRLRKHLSRKDYFLNQKTYQMYRGGEGNHSLSIKA